MRVQAGRDGSASEAMEIPLVLLFLTSDASNLLTGSIVSADGGYTSWQACCSS